MKCSACIHVLQFAITQRKPTVQVVNSSNNVIVAASTILEEEFRATYNAKLQQCPRSQYVWNVPIAAKMGENLADRLKALEINNVHVDLKGESCRPRQYKKRVFAIIDSLRKSGIKLCGIDDLVEECE